MAVLTPCRSPMDLLERWDRLPDTLSTREVIDASGLPYQSAVYRWMIRLTIFGYFECQHHPARVGTMLHWTITPKGRAAIHELKRIHA